MHYPKLRKSLWGLAILLLWQVNTYAQELPLTANGFIQNKGQVVDQYYRPNAEVLFLLPGKGMNLQIKADGFAYDTYTTEMFPRETQAEESELLMPHELPEDSIAYYFHRVDIEWLNANPSPTVHVAGQSSEYLNFYTPGTGENGVTKVHRYQKVTLQNLWPHIDVEFALTKSGPKYNLIVHPGGKIQDVQWRYRGAITQLLEGKIHIETSNGTLTESIPLSFYQEDRTEVHVSYRALGENSYGLSCGQIPATKTLFIDPVPELLWGTFFGGASNIDYLKGVDQGQSNIYYCGHSSSSNNIATVGSFQNSLSGVHDGVIISMTKGGSLNWGTYFGGVLSDVLLDIKFYQNGVYVAGNTGSSGLATAGVHQTSHAGNNDVVLSKFSVSGSRVWATYYGGTNDDWHEEIDILNDTIFLIGETYSSSGISTPNTHKASKSGGGTDIYCSAFSLIGQQYWGTYIGDNSNEGAVSIRAQGNNKVFIAGSTYSQTLGTLNACISTSTNIGSKGFLAQLDNTGNLDWLSYIQNSGNVGLTSMEITPNHIFLSGVEHLSNNSIINSCGYSSVGDTIAAIVQRYECPCNFVDNFSLNGNGWEIIESLSILDSNSFFFIGSTESSNLNSVNAIQNSFGGVSDIIFGKVINNNLSWTTYLGDVGFNFPFQLKEWNDTLAITTGGYSFAPLKNAFKDTIDGAFDSYLALFRDTCNPLTGINLGGIFGDSVVCPFDTVNYSVIPKIGIEDYLWSVPSGANVVSGQGTPCISVVFDTTSGPVSLLARNSCDSLVPISLTVLVSQPPAKPVITPADTVLICPSDTVLLVSDITTNIVWSTGDSTSQLAINTAGNYAVTHLDATGCYNTISDTVYVQWASVPDTPAISPSGLLRLCAGDSLLLTSSNAQAYRWSTGDSLQSIYVKTAGTYWLQVSDTATGCLSFADSVTVVIDTPAAQPGISPTGPISICQDDSVQLSSQGTGFPLWSTGSRATSIYVNSSGYYNVSAADSIQACPPVWSDSVWVNVVPLPAAPQISLLGNDTICAGDSLQLTSNQPTKNLWSTGDTTQSIWVSLAGTYFARQLNSLQCPGDTSNVLTIWVQNQPPKPSITANGNTTICQGDSVQLSTTASGPVLWSTGATTQSVWVSQTGLYYLNTNAQNVCPDAFSDTINITTLPTPQTPTVTPLGDTALCNGNPVTLSSSFATGNRWSTGDTTQSITLTSPGTVALWRAAASGCTSDTVYFTVAQTDIDLGPDVSMCSGESITLTAQGSGSYVWSTGASGPSINVAPATTTTYWAQEAGSGCSDTIVVTVHPAPKAQFTVSPTQGPAPLAIQVNNTSTGATSYSWSFGDGNTSTQPNPTHSYVQDGSYTIRLVVTNAFGCADTAISTPVQVISANNFWIPNSFTPGNRDGVNDVWEMQGIPEPYQFSVFDRWGNRVYYSADYQNNWDGTHNGQPLPLGAYTYLIEYRYINPNATVANPEGAPRSIQGVMIIQ